MKSGDIITFGSYPQYRDGSEDSIEWQVLEVEEGKALLLSRYILDVKPFNDEAKVIYWNSCTLRKWLNGEFLNNAFTEEEQNQIYLPPENEQDINAEHFWFFWHPGRLMNVDSSSWNMTDKVFLLSHEDISRYFRGGDNETSCPGASAEATEYVQEKYSEWYSQNERDGRGIWWLRSSSAQHPIAYIVSPADTIGFTVILPGSLNGIRPALWLKDE